MDTNIYALRDSWFDFHLEEKKTLKIYISVRRQLASTVTWSFSLKMKIQYVNLTLVLS